MSSLVVGATIDQVKHELHKLQLFYEDALRSASSATDSNATSQLSDQQQQHILLIKDQVHSCIHAIAQRMDAVRTYELQLQVKLKELLQLERKAKFIAKQQQRVKLNVGGTHFETTVDTLVGHDNPRSYFAVMLSQLSQAFMSKLNTKGDEQHHQLLSTSSATKDDEVVQEHEHGAVREYFIDRNPEYFGIILDHLRGVNVYSTIRAMHHASQHGGTSSGTASSSIDSSSYEKLQNEVEYYRIASMYHFFPKLLQLHCHNRYLLSSQRSLITLWDLVEDRIAATFSSRNSKRRSTKHRNNNFETIAEDEEQEDIYCLTQLHCKDDGSSSSACGEQLFASGGFDKTVRLWNKETHEQVSKIRLHEGITAISSLPLQNHSAFDEHRPSPICAFAVGTELGNIYLYKMMNNDQIEKYAHLTTTTCSDITAMSMINECLLASASRDGHTRIWNVDTRDLIQTLTGHFGAVTSVAVVKQPMGRILKETDDNQQLLFYQRQREEASLDAKTGCNQQAVILSGSADKTIRMWDIESGRCIGSIITPRTVESMCYIQQLHYAAAGHDNGDITIWNLCNLQLVTTLSGHNGWIYSLLCADITHNRSDNNNFNNSCRLLSSAHDGTIRIWNLATGQCERVLAATNSASATVNPVWSLCMLK